MTTYHVEGNHTLLYHRKGELRFGILAGKPQLGGRNPMDGTCLPFPPALRPATAEDFDFFRVQPPKGHFDAA
jgi:hypothetical protein